MAKVKKERKHNDLFGVLNAINNKTPVLYDKKEVKAYMLMMWLSHDKSLMYWVNQINMNKIIFNTPDELIFKYFYDKIPKKRRYIKWIKKEKISKDKEKSLKELCDKYHISKKEAMLSL